MTDSELILTYIPYADFVADLNGPTCEVLLHDLTQLESSVVYIKNPLTSRKIGDTITDFGMEILRHLDDYQDCSFVPSYIAKSDRMTFKSSTYFIRNDKKRVVGFLCVNIDISNHTALIDACRKFLPVAEKPSESPIAGHTIQENLIISQNERLHTTIDEVLSAYPTDVAHLSTAEKKEAVSKFKNLGVFLLKGSITEVSAKLQVSVQTVYRYLKEIENQ